MYLFISPPPPLLSIPLHSPHPSFVLPININKAHNQLIVEEIWWQVFLLGKYSVLMFFLAGITLCKVLQGPTADPRCGSHLQCQVQLMKYRLRERRKRNTHREWRTVEKDDFWLHNCCYSLRSSN